MKTGEVIKWLDATFHPEYQEDYDNAGFLLGNSASDYRGALVALDLTPAVVDEAVRLYHEAYDGVFDQTKADEARTHYQRAGYCVQIIVQVLHGETPSGEGVTITY